MYRNPGVTLIMRLADPVHLSTQRLHVRSFRGPLEGDYRTTQPELAYCLRCDCPALSPTLL